MNPENRRLIIILLILFIVFLTLGLLTDSYADEETVRRVAQEEGVDPNLAASVARCESGFREEARNGRYEGPFQMSPGWGSSEERADTEWATRQFAGAVRAGSASRHWAQCWPGRRQGTRHGRSVRVSAPTGTDRCDRDEQGKWRCHPSWTKPDALSVSPTIEQDPGLEYIQCLWREPGPSWVCEMDPATWDAVVAPSEITEAATVTDVAIEQSKHGFPILEILVLCVVVLLIVAIPTSSHMRKEGDNGEYEQSSPAD